MKKQIGEQKMQQLREVARQMASHDFREGGMDPFSYEHLEHIGEEYGVVSELQDEYSQSFDLLHRRRVNRTDGGRLR